MTNFKLLLAFKIPEYLTVGSHKVRVALACSSIYCKGHAPILKNPGQREKSGNHSELKTKA